MRRKSPRCKTLLIAGAVIVALLVRGTRQQRTIRRLLLPMIFAYPGEGIVESIGGFFSSVGGDIKAFVFSAIRAVADVLQSGIDFAVNLGWEVWDRVTGALNFAIAVAESLYNSAVAYAVSLFWQAVDFANGVRAAVEAFATSLFWQALSWAQTAIGNAIAGLDWALTTLIDNVRAAINVALSALHDVFFDALHALEWAVTTAIDNARAAAHTAIDETKSTLTTVINEVRQEAQAAADALNQYVFGPVSAVLGVIETVLDWLVALALFPFTTARDIWEAFRQTGGRRILDSMPAAVERWGDHLTQHAATYAATDTFPYKLAPLPPPASTGGGIGTGVASVQFNTLVALAQSVGVDPGNARIAAAIALAESQGNPTAHNPVPPDDSYGLWQINMIGAMGPQRRVQFGIASNEELYDVNVNARAMFIVSGGGHNWGPWTTYTHQTYLRFLPRA